ncbi:hypothetical protein [Streptomyces roseolus]|uniref:hypothetical protein n=1 Tax=Streptomyces roseolus TaxID=67358 RepID=UPI0037A1AC09
MTWTLSLVIRLLLRAAGPLIRRGLPHLALAAMATLVCGATLATGYGLLTLALWLTATAWPLVTVVLGLLGAVLHLAGLVGLVAVVFLMPLVITADVLIRSPAARDEDITSTV